MSLPYFDLRRSARHSPITPESARQRARSFEPMPIVPLPWPQTAEAEGAEMDIA